MNIKAIMRMPSWLPALGLVAIAFAGVALIRSSQSTSAAPPSFNALVHWRDRGHDWLLVADGPADQVVVYSAVDGRPLRRFKVAHGLQDVDALAQQAVGTARVAMANSTIQTPPRGMPATEKP